MERSITHVAIIGAGAVGGAYGAMLYDADPGCVSFVARGDRLRRLKNRGLLVNGKPYMIHAIDASDASPPADLLIVALKHHQLEEALSEMRQRIGEETAILSLMNGVQSEEQIGGVYGADKVLPAVVVGIDAVRDDNSITYTRRGKIYFGEAGNRPPGARVRRVQALFDRAGIPHETPRDMTRILWWKFMINVGVNQVSAALRAPYAAFQAPGETRELMESAMREVVLLASKLHISLTEADVTEWYAVLRGLNPEGKTSMLQDVEGGRKTEVEMFAGKVIELGRRFGVATPVNERLFDMIRKIEGSYG
jgi:2-dehydropantoate 2-reductase